MPKKIKKTKKVMTVQVPKKEMPAVSDTENTIAALTSMQASTGWAIMVKILNENIKYLEVAILEKIDPVTKMAITDAEVEILRTKRSLNIDLRDTPANYSKVIKNAGEVPVEYDPYFKTMKEIEIAKKAQPKDDR